MARRAEESTVRKLCTFEMLPCDVRARFGYVATGTAVSGVRGHCARKKEECWTCLCGQSVWGPRCAPSISSFRAARAAALSRCSCTSPASGSSRTTLCQLPRSGGVLSRSNTASRLRCPLGRKTATMASWLRAGTQPVAQAPAPSALLGAMLPPRPSAASVLAAPADNALGAAAATTSHSSRR